MKKIILLLTLLTSQLVSSQTYQLLPDSCTFCGYKVYSGNNGYIENYYQLKPGEDTLFSNNSYMKTTITQGTWYINLVQPFAFRQEGNKLYGIVHDSINEFLIMDFDAQINDTIYNLYSEGFIYNAKVTAKDSVLVNNNVYHHFMDLEVFGFYQNGYYNDYLWSLTWNERGICAMNNIGQSLGGFIYNVPFHLYGIESNYYLPEFCTSDPLYSNLSGASCENCVFQSSSIEELKNSQVSVYPNPINDELNVYILSNEPYKLEIIDSKGQKHFVSHTHSNSHTINVSELESGLYFIHLYSNQQFISDKFIKL